MTWKIAAIILGVVVLFGFGILRFDSQGLHLGPPTHVRTAVVPVPSFHKPAGFRGLTTVFDEVPSARPATKGSDIDLVGMIAEASKASRCDPHALALSARHLYDVSGQIVDVRLNEGQCTYTARIMNRN